MAMSTWTPDHAPDQAMEVAVEPVVITAQFGDGYQQDAEEGINTDLAKLNPKWTNLREAEAKAMIAFLRPLAKSRYPFYWTPPNEDAPMSLKCISLTYAWKQGNFCDITAKFQEAPPQA